MTAPIVGLTGGIACGKSTVAQMFIALGVPVVDADQVARDVVAPGSEGLRAIVDAFGNDVLDDNGALDRKKLGARVFGNSAELAKINAIMHPRIGVESMRQLAELSARNVPYAMYDAALLVENGTHRMFAALVVVTTDDATQRARLMARDSVTRGDAERRIAAQMPLAEKIAVADYVIENLGSMDALHARVLQVHDALVQRFASKGSA